MNNKERLIWFEMARRYKKFHDGKNWKTIRLWGLFKWGTVSPLLNSGKLITHMAKENKTVWVWPSEESYHAYIEPLLVLSAEELDTLCGWDTVTPSYLKDYELVAGG